MCTKCSLNWQHQLCKNPRPNPDIKTLFVDHSCGQPNGARAPSPANNPLLGSVPKPGGFPPLGAHGVGLSIDIYLVNLMKYRKFTYCLLFLLSAFPTGTHTSSNSTCWLDVQSTYGESSSCFWWTYRTQCFIHSRYLHLFSV